MERLRFGVRTIGDIGEMALSAGCTASLCAYQRPRAKWQYLAATKKSERGVRIIDALDELRSAFMIRQHTLDGLAAVPKMMPLVRNLALLGLALDAVDDGLMDTYLAYAGLPYLTSDTVTVAGLECEKFFVIPEEKTVKRRFTGNILKAGKVVVMKKPARRRLTANPKIGAMS